MAHLLERLLVAVPAVRRQVSQPVEALAAVHELRPELGQHRVLLGIRVADFRHRIVSGRDMQGLCFNY